MNTRPLGRTGLQVSEIGFGGWAVGGNAFGNSYGPTDDAESKRAVRRAFDLGCTFFDTADVYGHGHSEAVFGEALQGIRDKVVLATKVGGNFYNRDIHPLLRERIAQAAGGPLEQIESGAVLRPEVCVRVETYPVQVIDGTVAVQLPPAKEDAEERAA